MLIFKTKRWGRQPGPPPSFRQRLRGWVMDLAGRIARWLG
jgi:hypothetical protein